MRCFSELEMPLLASGRKERAKSWKGEEVEKRRLRSQQLPQDEKAEISKRPGLVTAASQPSVYLSTYAVKGTWLAGDKPNRIHSIPHAVEERPTRDPHFVKRRATTFDTDMSAQRQGKAASRRRLFSLFSKSTNGVREKATLRVKPDCPPPDDLPGNSTASNMVQNLVDSLGRHKSELRFSVSSLHDSIVQQGQKNCFQVSTFFPARKPSTRLADGQDRVTSLTRRWGRERHRSTSSTDTEDGEDDDDNDEGRDTSTVCLRRPAPERRRFNRESVTSSQEPHSVHRIYNCRSAAEKKYWLNKFQCLANPNLFSEKRNESNLHLCIQEIKGVPSGNEYFCEIYLDDALYARTPPKTMKNALSWSEDFEFGHLPKFSEIRVLLWMFAPYLAVEQAKNRRVSLPRSGVVNGSERLSTYRISIPNHSDSLTSMESEASSSAETFGGVDDFRGRKRRRSMGILNKKMPLDLLLIAKFIIPSTDITGVVDSETWYTSSLDASLKRLSFADSNLSGSSVVTTASVASFDGAFHRPANIKRHSQAGLRLSRKTLTQLTRTPPRLRLTARLAQFTVLPLCGYNYLLQALSSPKACTLLLRRLEPWLSVKSKAALAKSLLEMLQLRGEVPAFLAALVLSEVQEQDNPNMVLRSNSLATKAIELYLKQVGGDYLKAALSEFVTSVLHQTTAPEPVSTNAKRNSLGRMHTSTRRPSKDGASETIAREGVDFEVDPDKVTNSRQLLRNQANLMRLVKEVWQRIQAAISAFPNELRITFAAIREAMMPANGSGVGIKTSQSESGGLFEHVVSACVFLRFICPAILSPCLFGLADGFTEDARAVRAFTLVAKTILNLANFTLFGDVKELHMDFLNRFVAEEMPTMRALLWRLSEPDLLSDCGAVVNSTFVSTPHIAQLVDVLTVLKCPVAEVVSASASVNLTSPPVSKLCRKCVSIVLQSELRRPHSRIDFAKAASIVVGGAAVNPTGSSCLDKLVPRPRLMELTNLQSDVSDCQQAIFSIPGQLTATEHSLELEQMNLATSLAHCHVQLEAAFAAIPTDKLDQPLKDLGAILDALTHLTAIDAKEWHSGDVKRPGSQQNVCLELASSVSALSLAKSTSRGEHISATSQHEAGLTKVGVDEGGGGGGLKPVTPNFTTKAKSAQLVEQRTACYRRHIPHHLHAKQHADSSQIFSNTFNTTSEPGPLYVSDPPVQPTANTSIQTTVDSHLTTTTNASSWSLLHTTMPTPSSSTHLNATTPTFYSDSSCASIALPSPLGSSGSGGSGAAGAVGRPSNYPIMGTSLYSASSGGGGVIQRSCTFPNSQQEAYPSASRPSHPNYNPVCTSGRTLVSVETQTSREQVTELDETVKETVSGGKRSQRATTQRHLYINILDEFDGENVKLPS